MSTPTKDSNRRKGKLTPASLNSLTGINQDEVISPLAAFSPFCSAGDDALIAELQHRFREWGANITQSDLTWVLTLLHWIWQEMLLYSVLTLHFWDKGLSDLRYWWQEPRAMVCKSKLVYNNTYHLQYFMVKCWPFVGNLLNSQSHNSHIVLSTGFQSLLQSTRLGYARIGSCNLAVLHRLTREGHKSNSV